MELPEVGDSLSQGSSFGSVESVKAVEEVIAPISGLIEARNEAVLASPEELQNDPYGEGWLLLVRPSDPASGPAAASRRRLVRTCRRIVLLLLRHAPADDPAEFDLN